MSNNLCYDIILGDAIDSMKNLQTGSIDLIAADLPYGITRNKWDIPIPIEPMWEEFNRILKKDGNIVLTAAQPFSSFLVMSNLKQFRYDIIWEKTVSSGQLNVKHQPMRSHESILVFYNKKGTYNEQLTTGTPYKISRKANYKNENYNKQKDNEKINDGFRHAKSVVKIANPRIRGGHPTQKPVKLFDYIISAYSNENDTVLDCCMGHGTTGISCGNLKRNFVGIELNKLYFDVAKKNIKDTFGY